MNLNSTMLVTDCLVSVGPAQLFDALGTGVMAGCYAGCLSLILGLQGYALMHWRRSKDLGGLSTYLLFFPSLILIPTFMPLLSPPLDRLVSLVQDLLTTCTMFIFMRLSCQIIGGEEVLLRSKTSEGARCPLGTPPLCCLIPCTKPVLTPTLLRLILLPVKVIVVLAFVNLLILAGQAYNHIPAPTEFFELSNISTILLIPFMVTTMYTYKIFVALAAEKLAGTNPRLRGMLIFFVFVMGKSTDGLLTLLQQQGIFSLLEGLECVSTKQLILPLVQLAMLVPPCIVLPPLYSRRWPVLPKDSVCDVDNELLTNENEPSPAKA